MAKAPAKKVAASTEEKPVKKAAAKKTTQSPSQSIEAASETSLKKLRELDIDHQLQSEIEWCLASYRNDGNPVGLYYMVERAIHTFKSELGAKKKGVTAKLISDLEKAHGTRE